MTKIAIDLSSAHLRHADVARVAKSRHSSRAKIEAHGPVTIYTRPELVVPAEQVGQRTRHVTAKQPMSTPPVLLSGSEAARERAAQSEQAKYDWRVSTGQIGDKHDPYSTETITCACKATGNSFEFYSDGLGRNQYFLRDAAGVVQREEEWFDGGRPSSMRSAQEGAQRRCLEWVGVTPKQVMQWWDAVLDTDCEPDPMGPPSRYE